MIISSGPKKNALDTGRGGTEVEDRLPLLGHERDLRGCPRVVLLGRRHALHLEDAAHTLA